MMFLLEIILTLIVLGVVIWGLRRIVAILPIEPVFKTVIDVLIVVATVIIVVYYVIVPLIHHGSLVLPR